MPVLIARHSAFAAPAEFLEDAKLSEDAAEVPAPSEGQIESVSSTPLFLSDGALPVLTTSGFFSAESPEPAAAPPRVATEADTDDFDSELEFRQLLLRTPESPRLREFLEFERTAFRIETSSEAVPEPGLTVSGFTVWECPVKNGESGGDAPVLILAFDILEDLARETAAQSALLLVDEPSAVSSEQYPEFERADEQTVPRKGVMAFVDGNDPGVFLDSELEEVVYRDVAVSPQLGNEARTSPLSDIPQGGDGASPLSAGEYGVPWTPGSRFESALVDSLEELMRRFPPAARPSEQARKAMQSPSGRSESPIVPIDLTEVLYLELWDDTSDLSSAP
jgi:hypothetical protein